MALDPRKDAIPPSYSPPQGWLKVDATAILRELQAISAALRDLSDITPQATDREPQNPRKGTIRLAIAPGWAPLGGEEPRWVWFDGSSWVALP